MTKLPTKLQQQLAKAGQYIESCQLDDGRILWFENGKLDPWDHIEAAMGLAICGKWQAWDSAYSWLEKNQNTDGSWYAHYYGDEQNPEHADDRAKIDTNFVAYCATGLWHAYRVSGQRHIVERYSAMVQKAINFVLRQQSPEGDIQWALSERQTLPKDALITASASILRSIECAVNIANLLNNTQINGAKSKGTKHWQEAHTNLAQALKNKPWRFDRTWESKERFSMDWFYPVLAGIYSPPEAEARLAARWQEFVENDLGCRCVSDEPWVTIAESCELCLALIASNDRQKAEQIYQQLLRWQDDDGGFWTGYVFRDKQIWPQEKTTWTCGAILLAADAIYQITPAYQLLTSPSQLLAESFFSALEQA
ncbi:MAG: prenyltransferase [Alteromonadaceae bacterium]|nr:MAG: prenyltransferase [Alteromonadaceae bacterium]